MSAPQRELFTCFVGLFIVSLCVTYVSPFVVNDKSVATNKSSDLLNVTPSDNVLTRNGLNELQEANGKELNAFVFFD